MTDPQNTTPAMLRHAAAIGKRAGLRFVYAGNLPGLVGDLEDTRCPRCDELLIERYGYFIRGYHLTSEGACPSCGSRLPGRWGPGFEGQIASRPFRPGSSQRLTVLSRF